MSKKTVQIPMQVRSAEIIPSSINLEERTVEVVWTTGAGVERYDNVTKEIFIEELEVSDEAIDLTRLNNGAALIDSHQSWQTDAVIGAVVPGSVRIENGKSFAKVRILTGDDKADRIWNKIHQGILRFISVGYEVKKYIEKMVDGVRVLRAVRWTPLELSVVAVPADAGAYVRSNDKKSECVIVQSHTVKKEERKMSKAIAVKVRLKRTAAEQLEELKDDIEAKLEEILDDVEEIVAEIVDDGLETVNEDEEERSGADTEEESEKETERKRAQRSNEILDLCSIANISAAKARTFISQGKTPAQVRKLLLAEKAANSERSAVSSAIAPATTGKTRSLSEFAREKYKK